MKTMIRNSLLAFAVVGALSLSACKTTDDSMDTPAPAAAPAEPADTTAPPMDSSTPTDTATPPTDSTTEPAPTTP
jgi:hypothetical protein